MRTRAAERRHGRREDEEHHEDGEGRRDDLGQELGHQDVEDGLAAGERPGRALRA
ncbi:MAG: hypothetical protein MZV64_18050 [Ignavibacteriales bacterium]|nr:hypothetical protein [Ignavibacteriales bacterium]